MKYTLYIYALLAALLLAACADSPEPAGQTLTVSVTLEGDHQVDFLDTLTRAGDPGRTDLLPPPAHLYLWAKVECQDGTEQLLYQHLTPDDWEHNGLGDATARYRKRVDVAFTVDRLLRQGTCGEVWAVASTREMTFSATALPTLYNIAGWTSLDLRDLYATPVAAVVSYAGNATSCTPVSLYHCAAKADFTYEVSADLRATTHVKTIEITNLPTQIDLFHPTQNPTGTGSCQLTTNIGSQWTGRLVAYVPQQPTATLTATTTFQGRQAGAVNFTPQSPHATYTGWYRIMATITGSR